MSKSLELTIYEYDRERYGYADPAGWIYPDRDVDHFAETKRLTEAEIAAEYWAQVHDSQYAMTCELAAEYKQGREAARHWGAQSTAKATTLHRFATHPHYFEATGPESDTE